MEMTARLPVVFVNRYGPIAYGFQSIGLDRLKLQVTSSDIDD